LLKEDTDVDIVDSFGVTPLFISVMCGSYDCTEMLLNRGARANKTAVQNKTTPLHEAAKGGYTEICQLLLQHKVSTIIYRMHMLGKINKYSCLLIFFGCR